MIVVEKAPDITYVKEWIMAIGVLQPSLYCVLPECEYVEFETL